LNTNLLKNAIVVFSGSLFIFACSPAFDWRIFHQEENKWKAHFPAKPFKKNRDFYLEVNNVPVKLKMAQHSTNVKKMNFAVDSSEILDNKINLSELSKILKTSLEKNFNLQDKKNLGKNIFLYSGVYSTAKNSSVRVKLMTLSILKKNVVVRGIVYGESDEFVIDQAMFFLDSIK
jgi:hypothetical protein